MGYEQALMALKNGYRIARESWNGKGQWIIVVDDWKTDTDIEHLVEGLEHVAFTAIKTVQNTLIPWVPSQSDQLATDWHLVED